MAADAPCSPIARRSCRPPHGFRRAARASPVAGLRASARPARSRRRVVDRRLARLREHALRREVLAGLPSDRLRRTEPDEHGVRRLALRPRPAPRAALWSHHAEVAALAPEEQDRWLALAEAHRLSVHALRLELRSSRRAGRRELLDGRRRAAGAAAQRRLPEVPSRARRALARGDGTARAIARLGGEREHEPLARTRPT